jgi:glycosyltransferase involved in cell wall biosynthesis
MVAFRLFDAIVKSPREFELLIFADPAFEGISEWADHPRTKIKSVPFSRWSRARSQLWEQILLPIEVRTNRCDLVHHPIITCPRWNLGTPTVVTLHDLNFYHHPEWVAPRFRRWLMATAVPGVRNATHVVAISDYVLRDIRNTLAVAPKRSSRIYNGVENYQSQHENSKRQPLVILGVNLWQPHKNLPRLLQALGMLREKLPGVELHLAGRPQAHFRNSPKLSEALAQPGVRVLGYLSKSELRQAYAEATVVCYPSLEEGFGLPILEAMVLGTPVVTSNTSCLPEIAGGAAILVDPESSEAIASGLFEALSETPAEREKRALAGKLVAARFTWSDAAAQYIRLYELILRG